MIEVIVAVIVAVALAVLVARVVSDRARARARAVALAGKAALSAVDVLRMRSSMRRSSSSASIDELERRGLR